MKWARTLLMSEAESLEKRLRTIIEYCFSFYKFNHCVVKDIDATGNFGNELTTKINKGSTVTLTQNEALKLLKEDGQILELNLSLDGESRFQIIVRKGEIVDILGDTELPQQIIGQSTEVDLANYNF